MYPGTTTDEVQQLSKIIGLSDPLVVKCLRLLKLAPAKAGLIRQALLGKLRREGFKVEDLPVFPPHAPEGNLDTLIIGNVLSGGSVGAEVGVTLKDLSTHVLVCGATGFGKSTVVKILVQEIQKRNQETVGQETRILIFDLMDEYRHLLRVFGRNELLILSPEQYKDNPFEPPELVTVEEWTEKLINLLRECWFLRDVSCNLLREILQNAYRSLEGRRYPTIFDVMAILRRMEYKPNTRRGEAVATLQNRFAGLGPLKKTFACEKGFGIHLLLEKSIVFRVSTLSDDHRHLFYNLFLARYASYREKLGDFDQATHVLIMEEAHQVCSRQLQKRVDIGEPAIFTHVRTLRKRGLSFVIIEQIPAGLQPSVLGNLSSRIIFRLADFHSIQTIANTLNLSDEQAELVSTLTFRSAILHTPSCPSPILFKVKEAKFEEVSEEEVGRSTAEILVTLPLISCEQEEAGGLVIAEEEEKKHWVKVKETHSTLLRDICNSPFDGIVSRQKRLDWTPWFINRTLSELLQIKYLAPPVVVRLGTRGNNLKCLLPTEKGCQFIGIRPESVRMKGRGSAETIILQNLICRALEAAGKDMRLEFVLAGKAVDVCEILSTGEYRAYELESEAVEHVVENVKKDLSAGFCDVVVVTRNRDLQNLVKGKIYRGVDFRLFSKVRFQLIKEILKISTNT